jgi:hypothetical protein
MKDGPVLRDVDVLPVEHRLAALGEPGLLGQLRQQSQGLAGDPVLGVVEEEAGGLGGQALPALGVLGEQVTEVAVLDLGVVALQRLPAL